MGARRMIELFFKIRGGAMPPCPTSSGPHVIYNTSKITKDRQKLYSELVMLIQN